MPWDSIDCTLVPGIKAGISIPHAPTLKKMFPKEKQVFSFSGMGRGYGDCPDFREEEVETENNCPVFGPLKREGRTCLGRAAPLLPWTVQRRNKTR